MIRYSAFSRNGMDESNSAGKPPARHASDRAFWFFS